MDASADGPSWGRLGGSNTGLGHPPRNLLTQAAMQVLRESGDADSEAGAQRGRELGRHRTTTGLRGTAWAHSNTGSAGTTRGSTSLRSSSANRSQLHSARCSTASTTASAEGSRARGRTGKPVGFGSGTPSSRAAAGFRQGASEPGPQKLVSMGLGRASAYSRGHSMSRTSSVNVAARRSAQREI